MKTAKLLYWKKMTAVVLLLTWTINVHLYGQGQISTPMTFTTWAATDAGNQYATDIAVDGNGDSYTVGFFKSQTTEFASSPVLPTMNNTDPTGNTEDGYLVKFDKGDGAGNNTPSDWPLWAVRIGGTGNDRCQSVTTLSDGAGGFHIYVVGWYTTTATFESVNPAFNITLNCNNIQNAYLARYDQDGNLDYAYDIGGSGVGGPDYAYHVAAAYDNANGNRAVYIVGRNGSQTALACRGGTATTLYPSFSGGGDDGFLVRYDDFSTYAAPVWLRYMTSPNNDAFYSVAADGDGVSVGGQFKANMALQITGATHTPFLISGSSDIIVANYNNAGTNVWRKQLGGTFTGATMENATCMAMDIDGNTYAGGMYALSAPSFSCANSGQECFVTKISPLGVTLWNQCGGTVGSGAGNDYVSGIAVDRCQKHVYVGGVAHGATLNFGTASLPAYSTGSNNDVFFLELDAMTGNYLTGTGKVFGSGSDDVAYNLTTDRLDNVYMVGISNAATFNLPPLPALNNASAGTYDGFMWRVNECSWPAVSTGNQADAAIHNGISAYDCNIYACGDLQGTITYGNTTLASTQDAGINRYDSYFTKLDRFGKYAGFSLIAHGTAEEYAIDQAIDGLNSCLYVAGYAQGPNLLDGNGLPYTTVVGSTTTNLLGGPQYASLVKTDLNGAILWSRLGIPSNINSGSVATGVAFDKTNGYVYLYGSFAGTVTFGSTSLTATMPNGGLFVVKYNAAGTVQWAKEVGYVTTPTTQISPWGVTVDETIGDVYITGQFDGAGVWPAVPAINITSTGVGNLFVARIAASTGVVTKAKEYPVAGSYGMRLVATGSKVYVTGWEGNGGAHISKWNFTPSVPSCTTITGSFDSYGQGICMDNSNVYVTGFTGTSGSYGVGPLSYTNSGNLGVYVASFSKASWGTANCLGVRDPWGMGSGMAIAQDAYSGNLYVAGSTWFPNISGMVQEFSTEYCNYSNRLAGPGSGESTDQSVGGAEKAAVVNLFPNPSDGSMTVDISVADNLNLPVKIVFIDLSGRVVLEKTNLVSGQNPIDCGALAEGVYVYEIIRNDVLIGNGKAVISR